MIMRPIRDALISAGYSAKLLPSYTQFSKRIVTGLWVWQ